MLLDAAAFGCFALAWCLLCAPWLAGGLTIPWDAKAHFQAQLQFLANAIHTGQSPFWTPNVFAGSPQIADPQSLIFSPALLIALFNKAPSFTTVDAYVLALVGAGGLGIMLFTRERGWHPIGGLIAGLTFAFGGSAAWRIQHIGQIKSYALFGVALWLVARTLERRCWVSAVAAGIAAGLMVVEPDQVALLGAYVLAAYVMTELWRVNAPFDELKRAFPTLAVAGVVAIAIASLPVLMTYLFLSASNRPEIAITEALHGSLHPASLLTGFIGDLYGAQDPAVPFWGPYSYTWSPNDTTLAENMSQVYAGALPVMAVLVVGLIKGYSWHPHVRFFTAAFLVMTAYALGGFTPVFSVLYAHVPGVALFRRPADATFLMDALLAVMAGHAIHLMIERRLASFDARKARTAAAIVAAVFMTAAVVAMAQNQAGNAIKPMLTALVLIAASAGLVYAIARHAQRHAFAVLAATAAFATADLAINNGPNGSTALPVTYYDQMRPDSKNETIALLKEKLAQVPGSARRDRVEIVGLGFEWPNVPMIHGFEMVLGYNPLRMEDVTRAVGAGDTVADWHQRQFTPLFPSYRSLLADMLGLRYVVSAVPIERIDKKLRPGDLQFIARTKDAFIYENPRALPRVMVVPEWQAAAFEDMIETGSWPKFDPYQTVLLEREPEPVATEVEPATAAGGEAPPAATPFAGVAVIEKFENTTVDVDVEASRPAFVVMNSAWHPWWRAFVDGHPVEILKANVMFNAVQVPPGKHRVEFRFEPLTGALVDLQRIIAGDSETEDDGLTTPMAVVR